MAVIGVLVGLITTVPESRVAAVLTAFVPVSDPDLRYRLDMAHCNGMTRALIEQLRSLGGPYAVTVLPFLVKAEQDIGAGQSKLPQGIGAPIAKVKYLDAVRSGYDAMLDEGDIPPGLEDAAIGTRVMQISMCGFGAMSVGPAARQHPE